MCRRISESSEDPAYSDAKSDVLTQISRKAAVKEAKQLAEATQQEYVRAEQKARVGEETVRKVHQKQADRAMEASAKGQRSLVVHRDILRQHGTVI